jgi:hypothetical protein
MLFLAAVTVVIRAGATLPAPEGFNASAGNGQVQLQWTPVPSATAYLLYRHLTTETPTGTLPATATPTISATGTLSPTLTPVPLATVGAGEMGIFSDSQVTNGRHYLYQVAALDDTGLGLFAQASTAPFAAPLAVEPVSVLNLHSNALDFSRFPLQHLSLCRRRDPDHDHGADSSGHRDVLGFHPDAHRRCFRRLIQR